jgi:hypothetical protein
MATTTTVRTQALNLSTSFAQAPVPRLGVLTT